MTPVNSAFLNEDMEYNDRQMGSAIERFEKKLPALENADVVLLGINEYRGEGKVATAISADEFRKEFYRLHFWHTDVKIVDIGNLITGKTLKDSYAALRIVLKELMDIGKRVVIIGGSHDNTLAQYAAYTQGEHLIDVAVIDAKIDLQSPPAPRSEQFLFELLTGEPNVVRHYNHIGFQSYFVHPGMLETIDKLRFDCYRVGVVKEEIDEMEPVLRASHLVSFDLSAIKWSDAPASGCSPNGFTGEEACSLMRFAGMSQKLSSLGLYGYEASRDSNRMTAKQLAQMMWYFIDGMSRFKDEAILEEENQFNIFHTVFAEVETVFFQSKRTGRWWMQLPDKKLIACSYNDYLFASNNEIPERWLRAQERDV